MWSQNQLTPTPSPQEGQQSTKSPRPQAVFFKGQSKKKVTDPYVVGWFLGGQKSTRVGQKKTEVFILFLNSPHRETPKNVIK
jgi:hypothetical protein